MSFTYTTKEEFISFCDFELNILQLADIERTIDELFNYYKTIGQEELLDELCPYFGIPWPAGIALAHFLDKKNLDKKLSVLELGAGLAIPSLVLAKKGLLPTITDHHPDFLEFLKKNILKNNLPDLKYIVADWKESQHPDLQKNWDLIIASDILYDKSQPSALFSFLDQHLNSSGRFILSDPDRPYLPEWREKCKRANWRETLHKEEGRIRIFEWQR